MASPCRASLSTSLWWCGCCVGVRSSAWRRRGWSGCGWSAGRCGSGTGRTWQLTPQSRGVWCWTAASHGTELRNQRNWCLNLVSVWQIPKRSTIIIFLNFKSSNIFAIYKIQSKSSTNDVYHFLLKKTKQLSTVVLTMFQIISWNLFYTKLLLIGYIYIQNNNRIQTNTTIDFKTYRFSIASFIS